MADTNRGVSIRKRQTEMTRASIMEALAEIIVEEGPLGFTVQNVADRAGVSHRTVYRYFPNREAMCNGLVDFIEVSRSKEGQKTTPTSLADLIDILPPIFEALGKDRNLFGSLSLLILSSGALPATMEKRDRQMERLVREIAPSLPRDEVDRSATLIRHLGSSLSWMVLTTRFKQSDREAAEVAVHGIELAIKELKRRERQAKKNDA